MNSESLSMSLREKSAWASLITTLVIYAIYFTTALAGPTQTGVSGRMVGLLIGAIVLQVIAMIVLHIVFAVTSVPQQADERDAGIELRSERFGSWVLSIGVVMTMMAVMFSAMAHESNSSGTWLQLSRYLISQLLLLSLVASEVVKNACQVFFYRRGY